MTKKLWIFQKALPALKLSVNNKVMGAGERISFGDSSSIILACISSNSRPSVLLRIFNTFTNFSLMPTPSTVYDPNPIQVCNHQTCLTILKAQLKPAFAEWNNLKSITCSAENTTVPYDLYTSISYSLENTGIYCKVSI